MSHIRSPLFSGYTDKDFELLITALDASRSGIILTDHQLPDDPIVYCNKAFEQMTGYKREEIIGHNCRFLQGEDRQQPARKILRAAIIAENDCVVEIRNYKKNGDQFWNELYMSPIKNSEGNITHFIGVQNEITGRKHIEETLESERAQLEKRIAERTKYLRESEEYLLSIIETIRESLLVLDLDMRVLSANAFFYKTFKVSEKETLGKKLYDLGDGQWNIPALKTLLEKVLPNNPFEGFEVENYFPHIGKKIMLLNARRIEHEGSYKNRILLAIEEITDRRLIERRKDDFISIASHELKTPLTTIKGYVQLLEHMLPASSNEKINVLLAKTSMHVERLNNLINDLLDVSKIQSGMIEINRIGFDFDTMIHETVETVQATINTHKISVLGKAAQTYTGDMQRIEQVVINLLSNAIKYSPNSNEVSLHITNVGDFLKVAITDYGVGISYEDQKKIFERFFRADNVQKKFAGMGIGLYICEKIVNQHGGSLWVESEEGKGATFSFTLPRSLN